MLSEMSKVITVGVKLHLTNVCVRILWQALI